jgi:hypothetical protein
MILLRNEGNHDSPNFYHKIVGATNPRKMAYMYPRFDNWMG